MANRISCQLAYGGVFFTPVILNETRFKFMVDPGASCCAINRKLLDRITAEATSIKLSIGGIGIRLDNVAILKVKKFAVGNVMQNDVLVSVLDFAPNFQIDGLIGMNFLSNYRFTFEPDTATLVLRDKPIRKK